MPKISVKHFRFSKAWLAVLMLLLAACDVTLISRYDEVIDRGITNFQQKMDLYLIQKQKDPMPAYRESFYDSVFADLQMLKTRAESVPKNAQMSSIITSLRKQVQTVKTRDSSGSRSPDLYRIADETIDQNCMDALTLELAKKRGD